MVKWSVEIRKFDIEYHPRGAVKGQAIINFVAEYTYDLIVEPGNQDKKALEIDPEEWVMNVDGSSTRAAAGGGVVLITPEKDRLEYAIRFGFKATNNEAEYESIIIGLRIAQGLRAKDVQLKSDSQLVVGQVQWKYGAKDDRMRRYLTAVKKEKSHFKHFNIQVP